MKYMDKKYNLGTTKNICRKTKKMKGGGWGLSAAFTNMQKGGGWGSSILEN